MTRLPNHAERDAAIVAMYRQGATTDAIADVFGLTPQRISQIAKRAGVRRRTRSTRPITADATSA